MHILNVRVVDNDTLETDQGTYIAPTSFYMDVATDEESVFSIPISFETYTSITELAANQNPPQLDEEEIA